MSSKPTRMPQPGEGWRHYSGGYESLYEIVGTGNDADTGSAVVIYRRYGWEPWQGPPQLWCRRLDVFLGFTESNERRFTFERYAPQMEPPKEEFRQL